jgi:enoyl-CoA hydratase
MAELDISTKNCIVEQEGSVLIVTLNRPEAKNAFSPEMLLGMYKAWRLLEEDDSLMCAILTANGDTFCAGMDLKAGADGEHRSTEEFMELMGTVPNIHWQALLRDNRPNKPLILAVEGYALAGGTEMLFLASPRSHVDFTPCPVLRFAFAARFPTVWLQKYYCVVTILPRSRRWILV